MTAVVERSEPTTVRGASGPRAGYRRAVVAEWIKVRSLRSTWILSGFALLAFAGIPTLLVRLWEGEGPSTSEQAFQVLTVGSEFVLILVAVLGALIATSEFATGLARTTFAATPRRGAVLVAKATVASALALALGVVGYLLAWVINVRALSDMGWTIDLGDSDTMRSLLVMELSIVVFALLALGLGFVLRSSVGTIFTIVALYMIAPGVLMLFSQDLAQWIATVLPGSAASQAASAMGPVDGMIGLTPGVALLVLILWAVLPMIAALLSLRVRDV